MSASSFVSGMLELPPPSHQMRGIGLVGPWVSRVRPKLPASLLLRAVGLSLSTANLHSELVQKASSSLRNVVPAHRAKTKALAQKAKTKALRQSFSGVRKIAARLIEHGAEQYQWIAVMQSAEKCREAQPHDIRAFVETLARAKVVPSQDLVAHLSNLILAHPQKPHALTTASLVSSLAALGVAIPDELVEASDARMLYWKARGLLTPCHISEYLYALAIAGKALSSDLVSDFSSAAVKLKDTFTVTNIVRLLSALATAGAPLHVMLVWEMSRRAVALREDFTPNDISILLSALLKAGARPAPQLVKAMTSEALIKSNVFKPDDILLVLSALLGHGLPLEVGLARSLSQQALRTVEDFTPTQLTELLWVLASSSVPLEQDLVAAVERRAVAIDSAFHVQDLATLAKALATAGIALSPPLVAAVCAAARRDRHELRPAAFADLMWAWAASGVKPESDWVQEVVGTVAMSTNFDTCSVTRLIWALATLDLPVSKELMAVMSLCAVERRAEFSPEDVALLLWTLVIKRSEAPPSGLVRALLEEAIVQRHLLDRQSRCRLYQVFCELRFAAFGKRKKVTKTQAMVEELVGLTSLMELCELTSENMLSQPFQPEQEVAAVLRGMGVRHQENHVLADCGYRVDVRVLGKSGVGRVVILVDEAHDFSASVRTRDGAPVLSGTRRQEDRLIKNMGWHVVRIPWFEWGTLKKEDRVSYLTRLLREAEEEQGLLSVVKGDVDWNT